MRWCGVWEAGGEWVGVGPRYSTNTETDEMGGYSLVNLTARYALSKELSIEGRINNLFDKNYETVHGYTAGFNAFVGVRYQPK